MLNSGKEFWNKKDVRDNVDDCKWVDNFIFMVLSTAEDDDDNCYTPCNNSNAYSWEGLSLKPTR